MEEFLIKGETLVRYTGHSERVTVPEGVVIIGAGAFARQSGIRSVTLPQSLRVIESRAFERCENLRSVHMAQGVESIGDFAFLNCSLLSAAVLPEGLRSLGTGAFKGCVALFGLRLPESLEAIGDECYSSCISLGKVEIPAAVTRIGAAAFGHCTALVELTLHDGLQQLEAGAFGHCVSLEKLCLPGTVERLGNFCFEGCEALKLVELEEGVREVGLGAFRGCDSLRWVRLPDSLEVLGEQAFLDCMALEQVSLPDHSVAIGSGAFSGCYALEESEGFVVVRGTLYTYSGGKRTVRIPPWVECVDREAFSGVAGMIWDLYLPDSVETLEYGWLSPADEVRLHLQDISLLAPALRPWAALGFVQEGGSTDPERRASHHKYMSGNALRLLPMALEHPELLMYLLGNGLVQKKHLEGYSEGIRKTGDPELMAALLRYEHQKVTPEDRERDAQRLERLSDTVFRRSLERDDRQGLRGLKVAFAGRRTLFLRRRYAEEYTKAMGAVLASGVSSKVDFLVTDYIEGAAVRKAQALGLEILTEAEFMERGMQERFPYFGIQEGKLELYVGTGGEILIPEGTKSICTGAFEHCPEDFRLSFPGGVLELEEGAFRGNHHLREIRLPESLQTIGIEAFYGCTGLTRLRIPAAVRYIGKNAFQACPGLTLVVQPGSEAEQYAKAYKIPFERE